MSRIGVDSTFVRPGLTGGAEQMLDNLLDALRIAAEPGDRLLVYGNDWWRKSGTDLDWIRAPGGRNRFVQSWRLYRRYAADLDAILFPNYFTPPARGAKPRVVTVIHDLQYLVYPRNFSLAKRMWLRRAHMLTLRSADVVVTPSEDVRVDVIARYGSRWTEKLVAIPNAISWDRFEPSGGVSRSRTHADGRYVLSVSAQYPHKNLGTLLRAFAALRSRRDFEDVQLVLAGQWSDRLVGIARRVDLKGEVDRLGIGGAVRLTGYLSEPEIGDLYRGATVFAFPSLFEGFGMPAVEALGFGLPVLTTRCSAIPETTLNLATYVDDPLDAAEMADALAAMLAAPESFRPTAQSIDRVRATYALKRIGDMYYKALIG